MKKIMESVNQAAQQVAAASEKQLNDMNTKEVTKAMESTLGKEIKPEVKPETKPQPKVPEADLKVLINKLPDRVTPKQLCELFAFDDGGKTVRRHLRSKFAAPSNHEHKADWVWAKNDPVLKEVVTYFAERYTAPALKKTEAK